MRQEHINSNWYCNKKESIMALLILYLPTNDHIWVFSQWEYWGIMIQFSDLFNYIPTHSLWSHTHNTSTSEDSKLNGSISL